MPFSIRQKSYIFISIAMVELSLLAVLSSVGARNIGTMQLLFFVFLIGSLTSFSIVLIKKRTAELMGLIADRKSFAVLAVAGTLNFAGAQLFLTLGVLGTNPVITTIVLKLWPIFLAIMIPFIVRTKVQWPQMLALLMAFAGVYVIITNGALVSINMHELPYIGLVVLSTLCTAFSNAMIKGRNHDIYGEVFLFNFSSLALIAVLIPVMGVHLNFGMNVQSLISILFLGAITYTAGSLLFFYTLKALDPLVAANASYSTPLLAMLFSFLILGTPIETYYFYALAPIIGALIIQNTYSKKAPRYLRTKRESPVQFFDVTGAFIDNTHPHIHSYIKGRGRALAIKLNAADYSGYEGKNDYGCLIFTNSNPPESVQKREIDFIEDIMGAHPDEVILTAIGDAESAAQALDEYNRTRMRRSL